MAWEWIKKLSLGGKNYNFNPSSSFDPILAAFENGTNIYTLPYNITPGEIDAPFLIGIINGHVKSPVDLADSSTISTVPVLQVPTLYTENRQVNSGYIVDFPQYESGGTPYTMGMGPGSTGYTQTFEQYTTFRKNGADYAGPFLTELRCDGVSGPNGWIPNQYFGMSCVVNVTDNPVYDEEYGGNITRTGDNFWCARVYAVNHELQEACCVKVTRQRTEASGEVCGVEALTESLYTNSRQQVYTYLAGAIAPDTVEEWEPVPQVTGDGLTTPLAKVRPAFINNGQPVTSATSDKIDLVGMSASRANLTGVINSIDPGETYEKYLYSGANYLNLTKISGDAVAWTALLEFYNAEDTLIYSYTYNKVLGGDLYLSAIRKVGEDIVHLSCIQYDGSTYSYNTEVCSESDGAALYEWFIGSGGTPDPYKEDVIDDPQGGIDFYPRPTDKIGRGDLPALSGLGSKFFTAYEVEESELADLAGELWNPTFWDEIKEQYQTPADVLTGVYMLPVTPEPDEINFGTYITAGKVTFTTKANPLLQRYKTIDFGHIDMLPHWDSYLDFGKYTSIRLYLPFIGEVNLNTDELMAQIDNVNGNADIVGVGCSLGLSYQFDYLTGIISALLFVNGSLLYQWTGNAKIDLPISWRTNTQATNETISLLGALGGVAIAGAGVALAPLTGSASAVIGAKIGAAVAGANAIKSTVNQAEAVNYKQEVHTNGAVGGLAGAMDCKYPYITITTPRVVMPASEEAYTGMASMTQSKIGAYATAGGFVNASGVVVAKSVQLEGDCGTQAERDEIITYLEGGVLL